ncbi:MAG: glycosyltransferase [Chloroflexota bacterium]|nr:glycosyltransferase [Chloroflexota bacterium]
MPTIYMLPTPEQAQRNPINAINRVVLELAQRLPALGITFADTPEQADVVIGHAGQTYSKTRPLDIAVCHGLYPTAEIPNAPKWMHAANRDVINSLLAARHVIVPSRWVKDMLAKDMRIDASIVGWGVDSTLYTPGHNQGYVLWNKARRDQVSDPAPMNALAQKAPYIRFLSTFGDATRNVKLIEGSPVPPDEMRALVQGASVYLATTRETFGIGTLEAMACGVPILGYQWGATPDLVQHGVNGYLVEPGDIDGLERGLRYCLAYRDVLGANARDVAESYSWDLTAAHFANIVKAVRLEKQGLPERPQVSVVIPCHNYVLYVTQAIQSVLDQQGIDRLELIVVDDASTDYSFKVASQYLDEAADDVTDYHLSWHVKRLEENVGVAEARNIGIKEARAPYIVCLDADDRLGRRDFLRILRVALDADPALGIAYTGLSVLLDDHRVLRSDFPPEADFDKHLAGHNQVPTCCMFRKEAWERAGGYRSEYIPAEDANLWLRMGLLGYAARKITPEGIFHYRVHGESLSQAVRDGKMPEPNWHDLAACDDPKVRPFASAGTFPNGVGLVQPYDKPDVTVVIRAQGTLEHLRTTLNNLEKQSLRNVQVIALTNDHYWQILAQYPYVHVATPAGQWISQGAALANGKAILPLMAGDTLAHVDVLRTLYSTFAEHGAVVYMNDVHGYVTAYGYDNATAQQESVQGYAALIPRHFAQSVQALSDPNPTITALRYPIALARACVPAVKLALEGIVYASPLPDVRSGDALVECPDTGKAEPMAEQSSPMKRVVFEYPNDVATHVYGESGQFYKRRVNGEELFVYAEDADRPTKAPGAGYLRSVVAAAVVPTEDPPPPVPSRELSDDVRTQVEDILPAEYPNEDVVQRGAWTLTDEQVELLTLAEEEYVATEAAPEVEPPAPPARRRKQTS